MNEPDRTIEVSLKNPKARSWAAAAVYTYTIMDNDPEPAVTFTDGEPAGEGERGEGDHRGGAFGPVGLGRDRAAHGERDGEDSRELHHHAGPAW